jgi:hypothetical protein
VDDPHDGPYAREPQIEDLARICRALNEAGARYILIGGFAVIAHGGGRTTKDIDLLVDAGPDNVALVKQALRILEDRAVDEVTDTDVARYAVVRVCAIPRRICRHHFADPPFTTGSFRLLRRRKELSRDRGGTDHLGECDRIGGGQTMSRSFQSSRLDSN